MRIVPQGLQDSLDETTNSLARQNRSLDMSRQLRAVELKSEQLRLTGLETDKTDAEQFLANLRQMKSSGFASTGQIADAQKAADRASAAVAEQMATMESSALRFQFAEADAQAEIDRMKAQIAKLRARISACSIKSPVRARVMKLSANRGAFVSTFSPLATLGDLMAPVIDLQVSEQISPRIVVGQPVSIAVQDKAYHGKVLEKSLMVEQAQGSTQQLVGVRVGFVEFPEGYTLGETVSAQITIGQKSKALTLPRGAFLTTGGGLTLYRIEGNKAYKTESGVGIVTSSVVEILRGAEEGDKIITSSYQDFMTYKEITLGAEGGEKGDSAGQSVQDLRSGSGQDRSTPRN
jgi:HlyD family secretion protein